MYKTSLTREARAVALLELHGMLPPNHEELGAAILIPMADQIPMTREIEGWFAYWIQLTNDAEFPDKYLSQQRNYELTRKVLAANTGIPSPFPTKIFGGVPSETKKRLLCAWYIARGYDITIKKRDPTPEQAMLVKATDGKRFFVNAGPGSGKTETCCMIIDEVIERYPGHNILYLAFQNSVAMEMHDRLRCRGLGKLVKREIAIDKTLADARVFIMTIDAFARYVTGKPDHSATFDDVISSANRIMLDHTQKRLVCTNKLTNPTIAKPIFTVLIIDECNMIDAIRGQFISHLSGLTFLKNVFAFGDPRQSISSDSGQWFKDLKTSKTFIPCSLSLTHRFQTTQMLELANRISRAELIEGPLKEARQGIHVEMRPAKPLETLPGNPEELLSIRHIGEIEEIAAYLKQSFDNGMAKPSDYCMIFPSLNRNNASSKLAKQIMLVLTRYGIPYGSPGLKNYFSSGITISTIHGSSGREWKYVILVGFDNFPLKHQYTYGDHGVSQLYVAMTRATHSTSMIVTNGFRLPIGISSAWCSNPELLAATSYENERYAEPDVKSMSMHRIEEINGSGSFFSANGYQFTTVNVRNIPEVNIMDLVIRVCGGIACEVVEMEEREVEKAYQNGEICYGHYIAKEGDPVMVRPAGCEDDPAVFYYRSMRQTPIVSAKNAVETVVAELKQLLPGVNLGCGMPFPYYFDETDLWSWCPLCSNDAIVVYTENAWCAVLTAALFFDSFDTEAGQPIKIIQLSKDRICEVRCDVPLRILRHAARSITEIAQFHILETFRNYVTGVVPTRDPNAFVVDTEFTRVGQHVYDISVINAANPFDSVVQRICHSELRGAAYDAFVSEVCATAKCHEDDIHASRNVDEIKNLLSTLLVNRVNPRVYYHNAEKDVSLLPAGGFTAVNTMASLSSMCAKTGGFRSNSKAVNLGDVCNTLLMPVETDPGTEHTSLTDALKLYMLFRRGVLASADSE